MALTNRKVDWTAEDWYQKRKKYDPSQSPANLKVIKPVSASQAAITGLDKVKIIALILCVGVLCIGLIISTAYVANVRHEINTINRQSATLQGQIQNLNVEIKSAANIRAIEERATNELGMIRPTDAQRVFIQRGARPQGDFAMRLMVQAYNLRIEI